MRLGAHQSSAGTLANAFALAQDDGCESLQIFSRSSRQWASNPLSSEHIEGWKQAWAASPIAPSDVLIHTSYLINLCAPDADVRTRSEAAFCDEILRAAQLGVRLLNTHPGAVKEQSESWGCVEVAATIDRCLERVGAEGVTILLENTAGQGSNIGYRFEHLRDILAASRYPDRLAVCIDTCHAFAAGYDLRTPEACERTFEALDRVVGLSRVAALHLNDSAGTLGNRRDRHEQIGAGGIGLEGFRWLVNHAALSHLPAALETPPLESGETSFRANLDLLRSLRA